MSGPVFLPHLLADDPADGVGGILLHLGRGVGVGVQGKPCRIVAQRAGQRFHVYPAFQRQRGEGVSEIMEPDVFRADGLQNFVMGSAEGIRVIHSPGLGRWKQIRIARVFLMFGDQQIHRLMREGQCTDGISRFRGAYNQFPVDSVHLLGDGECPVFNIQVRPLEGQQFSPPQAGGQFQIESGEKPSALRFRKVHPDFLLRQNFHFPFLELRQFAALGGIAEDEPLRHRLLQAVVQQRVDAPHHSGAEAFVLEFREVFALDSPAFLEVVVKPLDLNGSQLVQRDAANSGNDVVLDVVGVVGFGVWPDAGLGVDLVPRFHP